MAFAVGGSLRSFGTAGAFALCLGGADLRSAAHPGAAPRSAFLRNLQAVLPGRADLGARRATRADAIPLLLLAARNSPARRVRCPGGGAAGGDRSAARRRALGGPPPAGAMAGPAPSRRTPLTARRLFGRHAGPRPPPWPHHVRMPHGPA